MDAQIGEYVITARKDRNSENWCLGALTNGEARNFDLALSFLDSKKTHEASVYEDGNGANFITNPETYKIHKIKVKSSD